MYGLFWQGRNHRCQAKKGWSMGLIIDIKKPEKNDFAMDSPLFTSCILLQFSSTQYTFNSSVDENEKAK